MSDSSPNKLMPVLFLGHGSPMNAIADNEYTRVLNRLGEKIRRPRAVLCVSAHWMTEGSWLTGQAKPKTIHDFYGFPDELFAVQYRAPGDPDLSAEIKKIIPELQIDSEMWGFDHGMWSVMKHLYPAADIPTIQLSIYMERPGDYHYQLGTKLRFLREKDVLIVGSGNLVHNLRKLDWNTDAKPYEWAMECDDWMRTKILEKDHSALVNDYTKSDAGKLSIPSPDHYYPFLYCLGASGPEDGIKFEFEAIHNASISMRCVSFGL